VKQTTGPVLCGLLVHWFDEAGCQELLASWPADPRFDLIIVDNGSNLEMPSNRARLLHPGRNLGFGGAVNFGLEHTQAPIILILNTDIKIRPEALDRLLDGFDRHPEAAGMAPRLLDASGESQHRWQLRSLPKVWTLLGQALMLPVGQGPSREPEQGSAIEQPAAAALALRRQVLEKIGGFDEGFYPAWFEDVDLATRLSHASHTIRYWPDAEFEHQLGGSLSMLGLRRFLWIYYCNLCRYLEKHHGHFLAFTARCLLVLSSLTRLLLLPIRKPDRARDRSEAANALLHLALGALTAWRFGGYDEDPRVVGRTAGTKEA